VIGIGKIESGKVDYLVDSVARSAEDYYVGTGEAQGYFLGGGLQALGLEEGEEVTAEALHRLLDGCDPTTGERLSRHSTTIPGFDATAKAPKSVSVLWGLSDEETRGKVQSAHDEAIKAAVAYIEAEAAWGRQGHGGAQSVQADGFVVGAFRHRSSRAGDPHLHTHLVVPNSVRRPDGTWGAYDHRRLYAAAKTGGFVYQAELRKRMTEALGVEWGAVENGHAEIQGVDEALCKHFSKRRQEVLDEMERRGETSARAAQTATLNTRRPKAGQRDATTWSVDAGDYGVAPTDAEGMYDRWRRESVDAGYGPPDPAETLHRAEAEMPTEKQTEECSRRMAGPEGVTESRTTFGRGDVVQAWCEGPGMATAGADAVLAEADTWLTGPEVVHLSEGRDSRYSTQDMLRVERRLIHSAESRQQAGVAQAEAQALEMALSRRETLSTEQQAMVRRLATSGAGVDLVVGHAGTGKTFALDACRDAWEASGIHVIGAGPSAVAAQELSNGAGVHSSTLSRLLVELRSDRGEGGLDAGSVVILDEAGMVGTRELAELANFVERAGAKVVLVGDPKQLPAIRAGGALRGIQEKIGAVELTEVRRQESLADREALGELRHGSVRQAVEHFSAEGAVTVTETAEDLDKSMAAEWWEARESGQDVLMLAGRRQQVEALNGLARQKMMEAGRLGNEALVVSVEPEREKGKPAPWHPDQREFRAGDEVLAGKNLTGEKWGSLKQSMPGVHNGVRGQVTAVDPEARTITVRVEGEPREQAAYQAGRAKLAAEISEAEAELAQAQEGPESKRRVKAIETRLDGLRQAWSSGVSPQGRGKQALPAPGAEVTIPREYLEAGHVSHAYARTVHKSQGSTADRSLVRADDTMSRESGYVAMSRHRKALRLFAVAGGGGEVDEEQERHQSGPERSLDPVGEMIDTLSRSRAESMASEQWARSGVTRMERVRDLATQSDMAGLATEREGIESRLAPEAWRMRQTTATPTPDGEALAQARREAQAAAQRAQEAGESLHQAKAAAERVKRRDREEAAATVKQAETAAREASREAGRLVNNYRVAKSQWEEESRRGAEAQGWLQVHTSDLSRLSELRAAESRRRHLLGEALAVARSHPLLGDVPEGQRERAGWVRRAGAVAAYTERYGTSPDLEVEGESEAQGREREQVMAQVQAPARSTRVRARGMSA